MHASVLTVRASAQMLRGRYRQDGCDQGRRLLGGNDATAPVDEAGPQVVVATTRVWSDRRRGAAQTMEQSGSCITGQGSACRLSGLERVRQNEAEVQ
jgi:hypothetical protein